MSIIILYITIFKDVLLFIQSNKACKKYYFHYNTFKEIYKKFIGNVDHAIAPTIHTFL